MTKYFLFLFTLLLPATILAQPTIANPNSSIGDNLKSPQVHLLKEFVDHPVDLSRGLVDITIPVYDIKFADKKIPINLMFHASGLKASASEDGMLGLKWALNIGGFISREVRGYPDERRPHKQGIWGTNYSTGWDALYGGSSDPGPYNENYVFTQNWYGITGSNPGKYEDTEYDIFTFSLPNGESGKFILKDDNGNKSASFLPYKPYNLSNPSIQSSAEPTYIKFEITDDQGYIYSFGETAYTTLWNSNVSNCWHLTSITSPNKKDIINFEYVYSSQNINYPTVPVVINDYLDHYAYYYDDSDTGHASALFNALEMIIWDFSGYLQENYDMPTYGDGILNLSKITYNDLSVDFIYNNQLLNEIKISNANTVIKKASFDVENRLLNSVNIMGSNSEVIEKYSFDYYGSDKLPDGKKLANSPDYWGYYNSQVENAVLQDTVDIYWTTPSYPVNHVQILKKEIGSGNNRYSSAEDMKIGMIKTITYPTGGTTTFEYDGNKYLDENTVRECGGLIIKSITNKDKDGNNPEKREFTYGQNEDGIGVIPNYLKPLWGYPNYFEETRTTYCIEDDAEYDPGLEWGTYTTRNITASFPSSYYTFLYNLVYYDKVTEYRGEINSNIGKTENYYSNNTPPLTEYYNWGGRHYRYKLNNSIIDPSNFWNGNHLSQKIEYKRENGLYSKVRQTSYAYEEKLVDTFYDLSILRFKNFVGLATSTGTPNARLFLEELEDFSHDISGYVDFKVQTYNSGIENLREITEETFSNGSSIITSTLNTFNTNKPTYLKENTSINSKGQNITQKYLYPFDINTGVYSEMTTANVISPLIEKVTLNNNTVTNSVLLAYKKSDNNFVPDKNYVTEFTSPLSYSSFNTFTGSTKDVHYSSNPEYTYDSYDENGNPTQTTSKGGITTCYIWGYDKKYPIAKVENATQAQIATLNLNTTLINNSATTDSAMQAELQKLRTGLPNAMVTTYTYKPLVGVSTVTDPKGDIISYNYDSFGRLQNVKDRDGNILSENEYHYKN